MPVAHAPLGATFCPTSPRWDLEAGGRARKWPAFAPGPPLASRARVPQKKARSQRVAIVAQSAETVDGLAAYLHDSGLTTSGFCALEGISALTPATTGLVLFPDDFACEVVSAVLGELRRARPKLFIVLVTKQPHRYGSAVDPDGRSIPPLVLPKPSFGWSILDALRANQSAGGRT